MRRRDGTGSPGRAGRTRHRRPLQARRQIAELALERRVATLVALAVSAAAAAGDDALEHTERLKAST